MRMISRKLQLPFILAIIGILGFSACQKKDNETSFITPNVGQGIKNGRDTFYLGESRALSPELANVKNPTFLWLVNGTVVSKDSLYTFTPTEPGDYTISYKISSGNSYNFWYYRFKVLGKYADGFFIVNEGWFGHDLGGVNFYRNGEDTIHQNVFNRENPGKTLGKTTQFGAVYNNRLYLVSKEGPLVVTDVNNMQETGRIAQLPASGNAFCGVDNNTGLVSTLDGVYQINLQTLTVGNKISGITGQAGGMIKAGNYVFVMVENAGIVVLNATDFSIVRTLPKADAGISQTPDGTIWAGGGKLLYAINPQTLAVTTTNVPFDVYGSWGGWNATMFSTSTKEVAVFVGKTNPWGAGGDEVYKYTVGNPASLNQPFIKLPTKMVLYGAAVRYNPGNNTVVVTAVHSENYQQNTLYIYDAYSGALLKQVAYNGYFFPAIPVFK
ncbi:DUF5074 domain-containing protein [Chitinophaga nivalis]|uniref:DUF5074 domain-containing protein n=1 Tax=Chitinophaga nivalis TaxID=2991709 RepID=A0ABT3IWA3_9BACT|nr:DUF5074 domain-containing protein [Chitinophaga nivalis]MCW3462042.1 DUF5074 domain-containing protein [Chitinophaga nivalis]MCW3488266.1 DUF5074 domain-containing protein [Chitinophaga nivalis]